MISISILWCAGFGDDNEDKPDDYHDYYYTDSDSEAVLWAALRSCVLFGCWIWKEVVEEQEEEEEEEEWMNSYRLRFKKRFYFFSWWVESPATVKDPAVPWLSPEAGPRVAPGTSGQAVIRWQHMSLLRVHNLDAYM